jgi:N-acetylgalactosamine kinase
MRGARSVDEWKALFEDRTSSVYQGLKELYGTETIEVERRLPMWLKALDGFARTFSPYAAVTIARACGRVNLLGMHIDHRGGAVNALAVGDTIFVVEARDDDLVVLRNLDYHYPPCQFSIGEELPKGERIADWDAWTMERYQERVAAGTQANWSNYVRAGVLYMQHLHTDPNGRFCPRLKGMNIFVSGNVRAASGLSSSSSIVVASMEACMQVNDLKMSRAEMAEHGWYAEWYVGTRGGGGDHAAIIFGKKNYLAHIGSFPISAESVPLPEDCVAVLCNSLVIAAKTAGARNVFNQRVAGYEIGLLLLRKRFPELASRMEHLRDVTPQTLGVDEGEIYQMLKALPERCSRQEVGEMLSDQPDELKRIFRSHDEMDHGYRIRQVCLYGIAECLRSEQAVAMLHEDNVKGFGELINLSHDGDRVTHVVDGRRVPLDKPLTDADLDRLTEAVRSDDPERREAARLFRQPGGYDASCEELDFMVDTAREVPGVLGAGLVGAGLGGCIVVLVRRDRADDVIAAIEENYCRPRGLPIVAQVCPGVGGSGIINPD